MTHDTACIVGCEWCPRCDCHWHDDPPPRKENGDDALVQGR